MFSMFLKIDNTLIGFAQWVVRQFELFTSLSRKEVVMMALNINLICIFMFYIFSIWPIRNDPIFVLPHLLILTVPYTIRTLKERREFLKSKEQQDALPSQIKIGRADRVAGLIAIPVIYLIVTILKNIPLPDGRLLDQDLFILYLYLWTDILFLGWAVSYFFCTTSLPPGERKQRPQKNIRNIALAEAS